MKVFAHVFTAGDNLPQIGGRLVGVDITGYNIILQVSRPSGLLTKTAVIPDQTVSVNGVLVNLGKFSFPTWASDELEAGNLQNSVVQVFNVDGLLVTGDDFGINVKAKK